MQPGAARDLERMASDRLKAAGLTWDALTTYAGPRRLTLVIEGLPTATPDREEELKGPRTSAPDQALEGFLRKTGLTKDQLTERDGVWMAVISQKGRQTTEVIAETVDAVIRAFEAQDERARTPILMLTANAMAEHVEAGRAAGADGLLTKPLTLAALFDGIARVLALSERSKVA